MKREDIIDSMEYIEEDFLKEADQVRQVKDSAVESGEAQAESGKIRSVSGKGSAVTRKNDYARRWGTLVAGLAVFIVAAFVMTTVLRDRSRNMEAMQSAQVAEVEEDSAGQLKSEEAADAAEEEYAAEPMEATVEEYEEIEPAGAAAEDMAPNEMDAAIAEEEAAGETEMRIRVTSEAGEIVFALNDSPAARSLVSQLPLSVDTEPYSSNEIVFHPEEPLDTENGIEGGGSAGYLGYFAPWDNIVMYYGDFEEYPGLYILGEAVSGAENIEDIRGVVTVELY